MITPKEATRPDPHDLLAIEERIDRCLSRPSIGLRQWTLGLAVFAHLPFYDRCLDEVLQRYRAAGWRVDRHDDQREGDYLTFTAPKETP